MRNEQNHSEYQSTYRTGSTRPPKSYGGVIAVLLVLVITLCGIVSILSIANIRLTRQVREAEKGQELPIISSGITGERAGQTDATSAMENIPAGSNAAEFPLGISGESVSDFYQLYYGLPGGILICGVRSDSSAARAGIETDDILLSLDGVRILDGDSLIAQLSGYEPGQTVQAVLYRSGQNFSVTVTIEEAYG